MNQDDQITNLLREALDSESTPEQICAIHPHLLPAVRRRWEQCARVSQEISELFPSSKPGGKQQSASLPFPHVPGYQIEEVLGYGGVGVVYRARHLRLERSVALKMLIAGHYADRLELSRFKREIMTIAGLHHANIVQIYTAGELEGRPYFTMEFIEGGSLARRLAGTPQSTAFATDILVSLAKAIQSAHRSGIIHRDLKPANILITVEGVPKIGDFGLARQYEVDDALTVSGARVGTPSYMAPEQALGDFKEIGPAADIYSLGAILYEILTGRPPFRAESAIETERQLLSLDPVPPSRLNSKVPRDLETICLKCLQKKPSRRYADAEALLQDLLHFQRGEPIVARSSSAIERVFKWTRRHPAPTAVAVGAALFLLTAAGWLTWVVGQRVDANRAMSNSLQDVARYERQSAWSEARIAQERVKAQLSRNTPTALREQAEQNDADLATVASLESVRLAKTPLLLHQISDMAFRDGYKTVFADHGYGTIETPPEKVAEKINRSNIKSALVDAVYDWTVSAKPVRLNHWLDEILIRCDPAPHPWITQARKAASTDDKRVLIQTLQDAPTDKRCARMVDTLALRLQDLGGDGITFIAREQKAHPDDFWTAYDLGACCIKAGRLDDALRFIQVEAALRPQDAQISSDLGIAYWRLGRKQESLDQLTTAAAMDANSWCVQARYANAVFDSGDFKKAVTVFDHVWALPHEPDAYADTAARYTICLDKMNRHAEACNIFEDAISTDPRVAPASLEYIQLIGLGYGERIYQAWKRGLDARPRDAVCYDSYAELSLYLGHEDEYRKTRATLLSRFADVSDPREAERIGRACLLLPADDEQLRIASAIIDRALHADHTKLPTWVPPYFQFCKGLAAYRMGNFKQSVHIMHGDAKHILGPAPGLVAAMSEFRLGDIDKANEDFRLAVASFDWSANAVNTREQLIYHILHREAEALLLSNTAAVPNVLNK